MIISITSRKGGTGKTTTTLNLAAALGHLKKRVLMVDLDSQANLTTSLGLTPTEKKDVGKLMLGTVKAEQITQQAHGLSIIPASPSLVIDEQQIRAEVGYEFLLRTALSPLRKQYDYILLDCPPSLSTFTLNALVAADAYLVPVVAETYSFQALEELAVTAEKIKARVNPGLYLLGVLFTRHSFNARTVIGKTIEAHARDQYPTFTTVIRNSVALVECVWNNQDVFTYAPDSSGAQDYLALAQEIINRKK